ncbi:hypothetical protein BVC71_00120 [Marivivens niveibacter]|uniref:Uncharacterized protein n=1 Tax=Marivivens niveibacter TaxID=1930667 RepID=A0A251WZU8_9RHOB|nr:hypothetical protein [Marivivens niveibacter]OUD09967.1 hypothetical protein BVC71_00120 [Marivivens niveibacter]
MTASAFDSAIFRDMLFDRECAALFTDTAEVRAMMIVIGSMAKANGEIGTMPETAAKAIHRASLELQIDPSALAADVAKGQSPITPLIAHFQELMQAPEFSPYVGEGADAVAIEDTAQSLRLRQFLTLVETRLTERGIAVDFDDLRDRVQIVHMQHGPLRDKLVEGLRLNAPSNDPMTALCDLSAWLSKTAAEVATDTALDQSITTLIDGLNSAVQSARGAAHCRLTLRFTLPQIAIAFGRLSLLAK